VRRDSRNRLYTRLASSLTLALSFAAFVLALAGRPTWGLRGVAVGLVVLVVSIVMAWNLGFQAGAGAKDDDWEP
jgi:hypothetical protein